MATVFVTSEITGSGMNVPEQVVPNSHFESYLETSDEWIRDRTGIEQRYWAAPGVGVSEVAEPAARDAIKNAGIEIDDIDGIVFATVTPDFAFPSAACCLQRRLGLKKGFAFDVNAVCSGFIYALATADSLIASGQAKNILVVGGDLLSQTMDKNDRSICILFGDGAGAVVLSAKGKDKAESDPIGYRPSRFVEGDLESISGIYHSTLKSDGFGGDILSLPVGTANPVTPESCAAGNHYLSMAGREVFKYAVRALSEINSAALDACGMSVEDADFFLSHQANKRILDSMGKHLKVPSEKLLVNVDRFGNTSAGSVPILFAEMVANKTIKKGNLLVFSAFGGGLTWGAIVVRY